VILAQLARATVADWCGGAIPCPIAMQIFHVAWRNDTPGMHSWRLRPTIPCPHPIVVSALSGR
jgi:hypothetical protein